MPASTQTSPTVAWPEGVIARFLTVGGATVDISHDMRLINDIEPNLSIARCAGACCGASHNEDWRLYAYRTDDGSKGADREVAKWAQAHAETCRALPRPTA